MTSKPKPKPKRCWKCEGPAAEPYDVQAILVLHYIDRSYGGTFEVPLCGPCATQPHSRGYRRLLPR